MKTLGYMGPDGTFSHTAAAEFSKGRYELRRFPTIYSVIKAVASGGIDCGIVPIENSVEGSINTTLDALAYDFELYIAAEYVLKVRQNLLVKKGTKKEDIRVIASHPNPFGQCEKFLHDNFPDAKLVPMDSTVQAVIYARDADGTTAALGSAHSAELYGLDIMYANCNDADNNSTRFVVLSKERCMEVSGHDKSSVVFTLPHTPGSLYRSLGLLEASNINMLKIESRPLKTELGKYIFFIDIEGNADDPDIYFALDNIRANTSFYKFLGSYKIDDR